MTRKLLITSVGSGVGHSVLGALRQVDAPWYVVGANSEAFSAGVFDCDSAWLTLPVSDRAAFEARLIEVVEAERPALIVPGRDDDLPIRAAMRGRLAELVAFALVGSAEAVDICNDKYRTAKVLRAAGQQVHQRGLRRHAGGPRRGDLDGRPRLVPRQCLRRALVAEPQVRGGLPACLRDDRRGARRDRRLDALLQRRAPALGVGLQDAVRGV